MSKITICDRCGEKTTDSEEIALSNDWVRDLCGDCIRDLRAWVRVGKEAEVVA